MRGDVWVKENKNGEKVVCIDNGKFVAEKIIKPPKAKYKIKQPTDDEVLADYIIDGC
jgi:hypothetical protein